MGTEREGEVGAVMALPVLLLIALALLQALDAWTTWRILGAGGRELNPAMRWAMGAIGVVPALLGKASAVVAIGWYFLLDRPLLLGAVVLFYAAVVVFNFRSIKS